MHRGPATAGLVFALALGVLAPAIARGQNFTLDATHSFVAFQIKHLDLASAWGIAVGPSGKITLDSADPSKNLVQVDVKADSIVTGVSARDNHLKSPDFFDARQFPTISFKSTAVKKVGENLEATGDFTMRGVSKPLTVTLTRTGERDTGGRTGYRIGYETTFTIKRSDFGMAGSQNILADEVKIHVSLEGQRQQ